MWRSEFSCVALAHLSPDTQVLVTRRLGNRRREDERMQPTTPSTTTTCWVRQNSFRPSIDVFILFVYRGKSSQRGGQAARQTITVERRFNSVEIEGRQTMLMTSRLSVGRLALLACQLTQSPDHHGFKKLLYEPFLSVSYIIIEPSCKSVFISGSILTSKVIHKYR